MHCVYSTCCTARSDERGYENHVTPEDLREDETLPSARAPVAPRAREDADAGVKDIVELMTSGRWVTGASHQAIAAKHHVHPETVKKWATNASRIIRFAIEGDVEEIRARMVSTLENIVSTAMTYERVITDRHGASFTVAQPDLKAAVSAIDLQAKLLGLVVQKHEVQMTEEEARRVLSDARDIITAGRAA